MYAISICNLQQSAEIDEARIEQIERTIRTNRMIVMYNEAVELANRKKYAEAESILRRLLQEAEEPRLIKSARKLLADLERFTPR